MNKLTDENIGVATGELAGDIQRLIGAHFAARGLEVSPDMDCEMTLTVREFAAGALMWLDGGAYGGEREPRRWLPEGNVLDEAP